MRIRPQRLFYYREFPVLYVDDEPENLRIFELGFRREFDVVTAASAEEGQHRDHPRPARDPPDAKTIGGIGRRL